MMDCIGDCTGFFATVPRLACPKACIKLLVSPFVWGKLTCIAYRERRLYLRGRLNPQADWGAWESCGEEPQ